MNIVCVEVTVKDHIWSVDLYNVSRERKDAWQREEMRNMSMTASDKLTPERGIQLNKHVVLICTTKY